MKYDRDQAIKLAKDLFWKQGYQATKMRDIQAHLNMRPGSIYAAFGNKQNLFKEVLTQYVAEFLAKIDIYMQQSEDVPAGFHTLFKAELLNQDQGTNGNICLMVKTLSELDSVSDELALQAKSGMQQVEQKFADLIETGKQCGNVHPQTDSQQLAKWLQMQMVGLRTFSQNHSEEDTLTMINKALHDLS